jgi:hypothetical protein
LIDTGWQAESGIVDNSRDAAGNERYWDGDGDGVSTIDVGAYEYQPICFPIGLVAEVWQQQIQLSWQLQVPQRGMSGYRVYRNGELYAEIPDPSVLSFRDYSAVNDTLSYYLVALYGSVESFASNTVTVVINSVDNEDAQASPATNKISIHPNPFRDLAVISYQISKHSTVELKIYNLKGQLVRTLHQGQQTKGEQVLAWEGCDDREKPVSSGIYLLRITVDGAQRRAVKLLKL